MTENEIAWDLTEIFASHDDPKIAKTMSRLSKETETIKNDYRGKITSDNFTPQKLLDLFKRQEKFQVDLSELHLYQNRLYSAKMTIPESEALKNKVEDFMTKISKDLAFVELDVAKYVNDNPALVNDPILSNYQHILENIKRKFPHNLTELEEQLILEKDQYGVNAWSMLQSKWLNTRKIIVNV